MPFVSKSQQRWGNSSAGIKVLGGKEKVAEWNKSTPKYLPEKIKVGNNNPKKYKMTRVNKPTHTDKQVDVKHKGHAMGGHVSHALHRKSIAQHPFVHSSAHDENTMAHMKKHHMHRVSVAHKSHPHYKEYKAGISNVRHTDGTIKKMHVPNV